MDVPFTDCSSESKNSAHEDNSLEQCPTVSEKHFRQWSHVYEPALNSMSLFTSDSQ